METCRQCGATMSADDALCPACGTERAETEPPGDPTTSEPGVDPAHVVLDSAEGDRFEGGGAEGEAEGGELDGRDVEQEDAEGDPRGALIEGDATKEYAALGYSPPGPAPRAADRASAERAGADRVGGERAVGDEAVDDAEDDAPPVPAGTWASTTESEPPPPPERPFEREPETRRVRRVPERAREDESERVRTESRPVRARTPGRIGGEVVGRARGRGLAVAPAAEEEAEEREEEKREEEKREARVVAFPARAATASSSGLRASGPVEVAAPAAPPRWLASELLRDPAPAEPYVWTARVIATSGGIAGSAASLVLGHGGPDLGMAALFVTLAGLGIFPIPFAIRAGGFAVVASIGLSLATWTRIGGIEGEAIGLATMGTTLLAAAQLLRAVQRRSKFARAAMMLGIVVSASFLALDGGLDAMVVRADALDAWLGPLVRAVLMIVLALCLLGFLDDSGSSGNRVWPWLVLGWSACEAAVAIAMVGNETTLATAATPVFSAVAALGWMQVWATTPGLGLKEPVRAPRTQPGDG